MKRGKPSGGTAVKLPGGREIQQIEDEYKHLGILEADDIEHEKIKENICNEYKHRINKVLKSKLNSGNLFRAINTWAVSLYTYGAGIVLWTKDELK